MRISSWQAAFGSFLTVCACAAFISACNKNPAPSAPVSSPLEDTAAPASPVPTFTPTLALPTATPELTATPTLAPSETPQPTATAIIQTTPEITDLSEDAGEGRPRLTGTVRFVDTEAFRIFYTLSGEDAVIVEDKNGNAVPDYVEKVADALVFAFQVEVDEIGWPAPPPDGGLGGDDRYDVYLKDLDWGYIGFAIADEYFYTDGDNPNTARTETDAISSYMLIDNNFEEYVDLYEAYAESNSGVLPVGLPYSLAEAAMRISVAHELMHMVQYGYDAYEPDSWIWEATSSWIEGIVYPDLRALMSDMDPAFDAPDLCQLSYGEDESAGHWYSEWLFLQLLAERHGDDIVRAIWENTVELNGYAAIESALGEFNAAIEEEVREYHLAILLREMGVDFSKRVVSLEGRIDRREVYRPDTGVGQMGADYLRLLVGGVIEVRLHQLNEGLVVGIAEDRADIYALEDSRVQVDTDLYDEVYLIVLNYARAEDIEQCAYAQYQVSVSTGNAPADPIESRPRDNFMSPTN